MKSIARCELRKSRTPLTESFPKILNSADVARMACSIIGDCAQEVMIVLHLNARMNVIGYHEAARGSLTHCIVEPREVFRTAIVAGALSIIVAHNHPSGDPSPSGSDDACTSNLVKAGALLLIQVLDHVIVATESTYSYLDHGRLKTV